jgi:hypothetical protein
MNILIQIIFFRFEIGNLYSNNKNLKWNINFHNQITICGLKYHFFVANNKFQISNFIFK